MALEVKFNPNVAISFLNLDTVQFTGILMSYGITRLLDCVDSLLAIVSIKFTVANPVLY